MELHTIGHSNVPLEKLIELLQQHGIHTLVDVRSAPHPKYATWFDKEQLEKPLREAGIAYHYAGKVLGGRPKDPSCYRDGRLPDAKVDYLQVVNYDEVRKRDWFQKGIDRLLELASQDRTAILCAEEDPWHCHRHHLISAELLSRGIVAQHIRGNGKVEAADQPPPVQMQLF
jgi:uncharacterized protein (DUF488 family)